MADLDGFRVGVVTGERKPELTPGARDLVAEFERRGATAGPVLWTGDEDWAAFDVLLLRSCWDYHEAIDAFRAWLDAVEAADVAVLNPVSVLRWSVHKSYLSDLAGAGVPVLPTAVVERGSGRSLPAVMDEHGWSEAVVKPAVGTSSAGTWRVSRAAAPACADRFRAAVAGGDVLVQRFAPEIADGERSLVFLGGEFGHAMRRWPAADDFRAHPAYGGEVAAYDPAPGTVEQAAAVLATARDLLDVPPRALPYARVDGVLRAGEFRLMELELVEPHLGLGRAEGAVARLADAVEAAL